MSLRIITLKVACKRDIVAARQRARQIAGLLGYRPREQMVIAAGIFELACRVFSRRGRSRLHFRLDQGQLEVVAEAVSPASKLKRPGENQDGPPAIIQVLRAAGRAKRDVPDGREIKPAIQNHYTKPLPHQSLRVDRDDLPWLVQELVRLTPLDVFEEIQQQNEELLKAILEISKQTKDQSASSPAA